MPPPLLQVENLRVTFQSEWETVQAVKGVSFHVEPGETLALVGESGSGKTVAALATLRLLPASARLHADLLLFQGHDILGMDERALEQLRGNRIAMVFQEPMTALNPVQTIGQQIQEPLHLHQKLDPEHARQKTIELLARTGVTQPEQRLGQFPHQLSGGQRQRVMIAMALACRPALLIADEPTTALDVTIQAQILDLLQELKAELGMSLILITHDLPMVRRMADRVAVMRLGEVVESARSADLFAAPRHPYTRQLLASLPSGAPPPPRPQARLLCEAYDVRCHFPIKRGVFKRTVGWIKAVDGVSLAIHQGETVGVVGESGSGKTTLGEALLRLNTFAGTVRFDGIDLARAGREEVRLLRRRMQVVFQDPFSSLSPRLTVREIIEEGLLVHGLEPDPRRREERIIAMLGEVGLAAAILDRYPHEFSGGQRQRLAIARAMVLQPELILLDEPTSALDLSVQAQILELLKQLQLHHGLAYLFISHDLRVIRAMAHQVVVLHEGRMVEQGPTAQVFDHPQHPYTRRLLTAALEMSTGGHDFPGDPWQARRREHVHGQKREIR